MAPSSFRFYKSLDEWRHSLRDINFWLNGYLRSRAYNDLERKTYSYYVQWSVGVGPTASFTRAMSSMGRERRLRSSGPFDTVIEVDMKQAATQLGRLDIKEQLAIKVAEELGLLGQEYNRYNYKEEDDELRYYSYGMQNARVSLRERLKSIYPQIIQMLSTKKYLLVVENLNKPIKHDDFTTKVCLPPCTWRNSEWLISTTSKDVYDKSKPDYKCAIESLTGEDIMMLTLHSLHQAAKHISKVVGHEDEQYWHHVSIRCFHYATMLLIPYCSLAREDGYQQSSSAPADIASDELIRQWAAQGLITVIQERTGEVTSANPICHGNYNDIYQVGNVVLEAFQEYSLLQLPISAATQADDTSKSAAYFLAYHGLIAERNTPYYYPGLKGMQWISHVANQGWNVSREWLSQGARGPTIIIIRHCLKQSWLFMKLESDQLLAKLPYLRVLDLSYTPLESLPPSIWSLQKLQLLSLRGCYNLRSPFCFPDTGITACENNSNKSLNLLYLDLSYSNIKSFQCDFFYNTPSLQELLLVKCSNLEELPHSIAALSSLTTFEITGTQIKSFPGQMFEEMKKLQSLKLIDNKILLFVLGLVSKACGLIDLHVEGCESIIEVEVTLERHPTLRSFSYIGAPHMKRLSLWGCRKLEYVDIKEAAALEELDLSVTAIKELPENIPNLPQLRRLLLIGVPFLRRFPWHKLQRFPDVFYLDQCSDRTANHSKPQDVQMCVCDSRLFYSFNEDTRDLVRNGQLLKSYHVRVMSYNATRDIQDEEDIVTTNKLQVSLQVYGDVYHHYLTDGVSMVSMDGTPPCHETERHVEISTVDRYPHGLKHLLEVTKSISMSDDTHVSCLHDLSDLSGLEECKLRRCHKMVHVFDRDILYYGPYQSLKNVYVSHLKSLTHFYRRKEPAGFLALKHLHLEHCPRLEVVLLRAPVVLPSLVTLDILFCYNLKAIFEDSFHVDIQLPCLRRIRLQELPLLEHLHVDDGMLEAPKWEELHVRGCWSLRRLPRLRQQPDKGAVKVSGERAWWAKLRWSDYYPRRHRGSYEHRLPPASASIRERVVIRTYLR